MGDATNILPVIRSITTLPLTPASSVDFRRTCVSAQSESISSWRVKTAVRYPQAFRPAASVEYSFAKNWTLEASSAYSRGMGSHDYDAVHSGFRISYAMPFRRTLEEQGGRGRRLRGGACGAPTRTRRAATRRPPASRATRRRRGGRLGAVFHLLDRQGRVPTTGLADITFTSTKGGGPPGTWRRIRRGQTIAGYPTAAPPSTPAGV